MKTVIAFIVALIVGAGLALLVRSALHDPHADHTVPTPAPAAPTSIPATPAEPSAGHEHPPAASTPTDPHAGHTAAQAPEPAQEPETVNTICPICGMDVDPSLGVWHYQDKPIGIGCRACVDKIENEIDRYGPAALENKRLR